MRLTRIILTALAVAACAPAAKPSGYAPKWQVGDWWLTKTLEEYPGGDGWVWRYKRYDVVRVAKVGKRNCFVLQTETSGPNGEMERDTQLFYVRAADWLIVRKDIACFYNDKPIRTGVQNAPLGLFPDEALQLPRFPLRLGDPDTTFKLQKRDGASAELREVSRIADSASVKRLLDEGDSAGGRVVRPTGVVYQARNELGGDLDTDNSLIVQSLQLWSDDQPWRAYEELVHYTGPKPVRRVIERTWLVAVGHKGK